MTRPMLPTTGSRMTPAIWSPCARRRRRRPSTSLKRRTACRPCSLRHAGAVGHAERRGAGAGRDEQAIDVAVVAAGELDDDVAAGEAAGQADGAHRRLGAGADHADHLDRRHRLR